jgi:RNA polymerase-binding transcription factor DksA
MNRRGKLARQITKERQAIRRRLRMMTSLRASADGFLNGGDSPVGDPESAVELAQQEVLIDQEMRAYERLASSARALDQAWENLQRGTYGICRQCRGQIPQRRLEALPGAALCVSCQEEKERAIGGVSTRGGRASLKA